MLDSFRDIEDHREGLGFSPDAEGLRYLFVDFNAYFASVEQHDDPALRGRPVIVTPLESEHSGAIAASYEAKALGIRRGTTVREARQLCPGIAVRPARHDRYVIVHHELMREIERHLPISRICSIDECVCRLEPREADMILARAKAQEIKRGIAHNVGSALRCSIGLAPSSLLAKLASDMEKPDGLVAITREQLPDLLRDLPLQAIPGIGGGVARRLDRAGITDFLSLWRLQPKEARSIWGSVNGERFIYGLKGYDIPEQAEARKRMIGHSRVLSGIHRRPQGARIVTRALLLKAASRLRYYRLYAGRMNVSVRFYPTGRCEAETAFRHSQNSWRFLDALDQAWQNVMQAVRKQRAMAGGAAISFKSVTVYLHDLQAGPPERDLFIAPDADMRDGCEAELWRRIDGLNQRYGVQKIGLASQAGLDLNYLGVKIAFSRVPELAEFADSGTLDAIIPKQIEEHAARAKNPSRSLW
ncbi:MAG: type VI secretion protein ImpB [Blastomonas sp.]